MLAAKRRRVVLGSFLGCLAVGAAGVPVWKDLGSSVIHYYLLRTDPGHLGILLGGKGAGSGDRALGWFARSERGRARIASAYLDELGLRGTLAEIEKGQPEMVLWLWVARGVLHQRVYWRGYGGLSTPRRLAAGSSGMARIEKCQLLLTRPGRDWDRVGLPGPAFSPLGPPGGTGGTVFMTLDGEKAEQLGVRHLFDFAPGGGAVVVEKKDVERWWLPQTPAPSPGGFPSPE